MISIEGYGSLHRFYVVAKEAILSRVQNAIGGMPDENLEGVSWSTVHENVNVAAKYLVYDIILSQPNPRKDVFILRRDGTKSNISTGLLAPVEPVSRESPAFSEARAIEVDAFSRPEQIFGLQSLASPYWHDAFMRHRVFDKPSRRVASVVRDATRSIPVVDWQLGTISLGRLRSVATAVDLLRQANSVFRELDLDTGNRALEISLAEYQDGQISGVLNMLSQYDGCTVVAPDDWLSCILSSEDVDGSDSPVSGRSPKNGILDLLKAEPFLTKAKVKKRLFPDMPERQFGGYWQQAALTNPEIRKPGRRKTKP